MNVFNKTAIAAAAVFALAAAAPAESEGCTRVTFVGDSSIVITGRTLDWKTYIPSNLYVFPRGQHRRSYDSGQSISWTSVYGSVCTTGYDIGITEGMNEKGLVVNLLYLPGTFYAEADDPRPYMSTSLWAAYVLDNFATTAEAVEQLRKDEFQINAPSMPGGEAATLHMAISDETGNSAIVEYVQGKLEIHEGHQYQVLTNAPPYDEQRAIYSYWEAVGGLHMLPGTNRSQDRFARASFYVSVIPKDSSHKKAMAGMFGIIDNCAVPTGISLPEQPEISTTQWRTVSDQRERTYYFRLTDSPGTIWTYLREFDLYPGAPIMKLDVVHAKKMLIGNMIKEYKPVKSFDPLYRMTPEMAARLMGE